MAGLTVPIYQSQAGLGGEANVRPITPGTGQQQSRGLEQLGVGAEALGQAAALVQAREETVTRFRSHGDYEAQADSLYQNLVSTQDMSKPATIQAFGAQLAQLQQKTLQSAGGSSYSQQLLQASLDDTRSKLMDTAAAAGVLAGQKLVANHVQQATSALASHAYDDPGSLNDQFTKLDATVANAAPALTPEQQQQMRDQGRAQIVYSGVSSLIDKGGFDLAEKALATNPDAERVLGPDAYRQLKGRIQQGQYAQYKADHAIADKISQVEAVVGPLSREQKLAMLGLTPKQGPQTLSGWIADTEQALKRPLTQDEILKHQGIQAANGTPVFGNSMDGIALSAMTDLAPAFAHGITSPDQDRRLQAAITQYTQPREIPDPITGVIETHQNQLPPFMIAALQQRGLPVPGQTATADQQTAALQVGMPGAAPTQVASAQPTVAQPQAPTGGAVQPTSVEGQARAAIAQSQQSVAAAPSAPSAMGDQPQPMTMVPGPTVGLVARGNIDLNARPVAKNSDGSISTVRSISIGTDNGEVLIPTVSPDGKVLTNDEAIKLYQQTGQNLGTFDSPESANAYAERLHQQQAQEYDANGKKTAGAASQPAAQPAAAPPAPGGTIQSREPPTIFMMNEQGLLAGPVPAMKRALNAEPIGGAQLPGREEVAAKTRVDIAENTLINALQYSPRYAEAERKQIKDEVSISPDLWSNATNLRQRLIAIDDSLQQRQQSAYATFHNPETSKQEKAQAMNNYNAIVLFRKQLGVPPRVSTPDEARQLPPGTLFINPNGDLLQVPPPGG